jgi:proline iminopeptidase
LFVASRQRAPHAWTRLYEAAQCHRPTALLARCAQALHAGSAEPRQRALALAWRAYENGLLASAQSRRRPAAAVRSRRNARKLVDKYRIQTHYLRHRCWLGEGRLLALARRAAAAGVPFIAVHGTRDPVCPPDNLRRFSRAVPAAHIECVRAGHLANDPALHQRVAQAIETMFATIAHEGRTWRCAA